MRNRITFTVTVSKETLELLKEYAKKNSINKSALIDRLIRDEIELKTKTTKKQ